MSQQVSSRATAYLMCPLSSLSSLPSFSVSAKREKGLYEQVVSPPCTAPLSPPTVDFQPSALLQTPSTPTSPDLFPLKALAKDGDLHASVHADRALPDPRPTLQERLERQRPPSWADCGCDDGGRGRRPRERQVRLLLCRSQDCTLLFTLACSWDRRELTNEVLWRGADPEQVAPPHGDSPGPDLGSPQHPVHQDGPFRGPLRPQSFEQRTSTLRVSLAARSSAGTDELLEYPTDHRLASQLWSVAQDVQPAARQVQPGRL